VTQTFRVEVQRERRAWAPAARDIGAWARAALGRRASGYELAVRIVGGEARVQGKSMRAHWAHLVVHGALHLIGYDHEQADDARRMERREVTVLRRLGFANPYRSV